MKDDKFHSFTIELSLEDLRKRVETEPDDPNNHQSYAQLLLLNKRYSEAKDEFNAAIRLFKAPTRLGDFSKSIADALQGVGLCELELGNTIESKNAFERSLALKEDNAFLWHDLGVVYARLSDQRNATKAYRSAVRYALLDTSLWKELYRSLMHSNRQNEAKVCEYFLQEKSVSYEDALGIFTELMFFAESPDMARDLLEFYLDVEEHALLRDYYARILLYEGRYDDAYESAKVAYAIDPDNSSIQWTLARASAVTVRFSEALEILPNLYHSANLSENAKRLNEALEKRVEIGTKNAGFQYSYLLVTESGYYKTTDVALLGTSVCDVFQALKRSSGFVKEDDPYHGFELGELIFFVVPAKMRTGEESIPTAPTPDTIHSILVENDELFMGEPIRIRRYVATMPQHFDESDS